MINGAPGVLVRRPKGYECVPTTKDAADTKKRIVDSFGQDGLALNKPGVRCLIAGQGTTDHVKLATQDAMCREARDQYVADLQDAWKGDDPSRYEVARVHDTGDARLDALLDQQLDLTTAWSRGTGRR
jgi:hypothetical protein